MSENPKRGREFLLYINRKKARGVLSLHIKKNTERRQLKEYLCETPYLTPVKSVTYRITISALLPLYGIGDEPFVLMLSRGEDQERYENGMLTEKKEEITPDEYTKFTYVIESTKRRKGGRPCGV